MTKKAPQPRFIYAGVLYLSINLAILCFYGDNTLAMQLPGSMTGWTKQYQNQSRSPDVIFLGSSVMRSPLAACEKANFGIPADGGYCQSNELTKRLSSSKRLVTAFNAARTGLMVTDALLIEDKLLRKPLVPEVLVYGVTPRDFTDSLLWSERATEPFQYYFGLSNAMRYGESFSTSWQERLELLIGETVPLYSARRTLVAAMEQQAASALPMSKNLHSTSSLSNQDTSATRIERLRSDAAKNIEAAVISTTVQRKAAALLVKRHNETKMWQASIWEYTMRYFLLDRRMVGRQNKAFRNVLKIAKERGIKIIVINMPLPADNLALLPDGFHQAYLKTIRESCDEQDVPFLDLQADNTYTRESFDDVAHLNATGGTAFMARLTPMILQSLKPSHTTRVHAN